MPELVYLKNVSTLKFYPEKCSGCAMCTIVCPHGVFAMENKKAVITDRDACMECGACALNCADQAIEVDSGVGCASAIITGAIRGTEPTCDCSPKSGNDNPPSSCCC